MSKDDDARKKAQEQIDKHAEEQREIDEAVKESKRKQAEGEQSR